SDVDTAAPVHARPGRGDLLFHDRRLGDPESPAAVLLGHREPEPSAVDDGLVEVPRELVRPVASGPVLVAEAAAQLPHRLADVLVRLVVTESHHGLLSLRPRTEPQPVDSPQWNVRSGRITPRRGVSSSCRLARTGRRPRPAG